MNLASSYTIHGHSDVKCKEEEEKSALMQDLKADELVEVRTHR